MHLHHVRIVRCCPTNRSKLVGNFIFLSQLNQSISNDRINVGTSENNGPPTHLEIPLSVLINCRAVGRMRHINGDGHMGIDTPGSGLRSPQPNFLLYCRHTVKMTS